MKRLTTKAIDMLRKMIFALTLSVCIMSLYAQSLKADQRINPDAGSLLPWNYDAVAVPVTDREHTFAGWGWLPQIPLKLKLGHEDVRLPIDLGKIIDSLKFAAFLDFEVRKGSFGIYAAPIIIFLEDAEHVQGPFQTHKVTIDDVAYLTDFGLSYEIGRWHLGKKPDSPSVTVEPFVGARWLIDDIKIKLRPGGPFSPASRTFRPEVKFIAPVVGVRTFWDITEHWNLRAEGDYGGFDTDHLKETWNILGRVGYRYLYVRYKKVAELEIAVKGPIIGVAFEF